MNPLISVIIPVYNVEKYLTACIESIIKQTYGNLEIVLVDDGSTDGSGNICDSWAKKDNRIAVVHKVNGGLGFARNTGLDHAHGDYVMFLDSDDFLSEDAVETVLAAMQTYKADTVYFTYKKYYSDLNCREVPSKYAGVCFEGDDIYSKILLEMIGTEPQEALDAGMPMSACHSMYSSEIIEANKIRFVSEREFISEDLIFNMDYLAHARRAAVIPDSLYYYRKNPVSLSSVYRNDRFEKEIIFYDEVMRRIKHNFTKADAGYRERVARMFLGRVRSCVMRATVSGKGNMYAEVKRMCCNSRVQDVLRTYPYLRNPFKQRLFNILMAKKVIPGVWFLAKAVAKRNLSK